MVQNQRISPRICFGENTTDVEYNQITVKSDLTDDLEMKVFFTVITASAVLQH